MAWRAGRKARKLKHLTMKKARKAATAQLRAGGRLAAGQALVSRNKKWRLELLEDSNLVLFNAARKIVWQTGPREAQGGKWANVAGELKRISVNDRGEVWGVNTGD